MEDHVIFKHSEACLERLPVNVPGYEDETCSQFAENLPSKKNVSFSEQSSILYFGEEDTPDTLRNSSSVMFNHFDETVPSGNTTSHPVADAIVVIEKLPQTLLDEYIKKKVTYEEFTQKVDVQTSDRKVIEHCNSGMSHIEVVENSSRSEYIALEQVEQSECLSEVLCNASVSVTNEIEFPLRELKVLIHRLPDNLLQIHCNHTNSKISPNDDITRIPSVTLCLENSETDLCALKQVNHRTECSEKKKSKKVRKLDRSRRKQKRKSDSQIKSKTKNVAHLELSDSFLRYLDTTKPKEVSSSTVPEIQDTRMKELEIKNNKKIGLENHSIENSAADVIDSQECLQKELHENENQSVLTHLFTSSNSYTQCEGSNFTPCEVAPSAKENTDEHPSVSSVEISSKLFSDSDTLVTSLESSLSNTLIAENSSTLPSFILTQELCTEGSTSNEKLSYPFKKRLCVHLEKILQTYSEPLNETKKVERSRKSYFPASSPSKSSIPLKSKTSNSDIESHSNSSVKKRKKSKTVISPRFVTVDISSDDDDDVPLQLLAKNNLTKQNLLQAKSNKKLSNKAEQSKNSQQLDSEDLTLISRIKTFNCIDSSTLSSSLTKSLHNKSSKDLVSDDSSEENFPLSHFAKTSQSTNLNKKRKRNLSNQRLSNSVRSPLKKVMLDHCYHLPADTDDNTPFKSSSAPGIPKEESCTLTSNTELQSLIAKTKQQMKKLNKQNAKALKNKKIKYKVLVNSALQNRGSLSAHLESLSTNNKVGKKKLTHKKKKCDKKTLRKKQAKVYDMMLKYLRKEIKVKSKKKKSLKNKNSVQQFEKGQPQPPSIKKAQEHKNSMEQSNKTLPELSSIKVEPESDDNVVNEVERTEEHNESGNSSFGSGSVTSESTTEASPEPSRLDVSQSISDSQTNRMKGKTKDKYRLGFLSKNRSLRFYNACIASERLLLYKCKLKKKQRKKLKKLFKQLKKVCHIEKKK